MKDERLVNILELEAIDEVRALIIGDVVRLTLIYQPHWSEAPSKEPFVYCGDARTGQKRFIIPRFDDGEYIQMHSTLVSEMILSEGGILITENRSSTKIYTLENKDYKNLNQIIIDSRLK